MVNLPIFRACCWTSSGRHCKLRGWIARQGWCIDFRPNLACCTCASESLVNLRIYIFQTTSSRPHIDWHCAQRNLINLNLNLRSRWCTWRRWSHVNCVMLIYFESLLTFDMICHDLWHFIPTTWCYDASPWSSQRAACTRGAGSPTAGSASLWTFRASWCETRAVNVQMQMDLRESPLNDLCVQRLRR